MPSGQKRYVAWFGVILSVITLALSGCGFQKLAGANDGLCYSGTATPVVAFTQTVWADFQTFKCVGCHGDAGPQVEFAQSNTTAALGVALSGNYISPSNPTNSIVVSQMSISHQCGSQCAQWQAQFIADMQKMQLLEDGLPVPCSSTTPPTGGGGPNVPSYTERTTDTLISLPTNTTTTATVMQWDLSKGTPSIPGGVFQATVTPTFDASGGIPTAYAISNLTLGTSSSGYTISSVLVFINGVYSPSSLNYLTVNQGVSPGTVGKPLTGFPVLSSVLQAETISNAATDTLGFAFTLAPYTATTPPTTTSDTANFTANVLPILVSKCESCHGVVNNSAELVFPLLPTASDQTLRNSVVNELTLGANVSTSLLFEKAFINPGVTHGGGKPLVAADVTKINAWIALIPN